MLIQTSAEMILLCMVLKWMGDNLLAMPIEIMRSVHYFCHTQWHPYIILINFFLTSMLPLHQFSFRVLNSFHIKWSFEVCEQNSTAIVQQISYFAPGFWSIWLEYNYLIYNFWWLIKISQKGLSDPYLPHLSFNAECLRNRF